MKNILSLFVFVMLYACFSTNAQSPGGVSSNLTWWIKADAGVTQTSGIVSKWNDQTTGAIHVTATGTQQPVNNKVLFNYYPVVSFDSTDDALRSAVGISANAFFTITTGTSTATTGSMFIVSRVYNTVSKNIMSQYNTTPCGDYAIRTSISASGYLGAGGRSATKGLIPLVNDHKPFIASALETSGPGNALHYKDGGNLQITDNINQNVCTPDNQMRIGNSMGGDIAEIITYKTKLSDAERIKIESYLAIKYGITLTNTGGAGTIGDYVSGGGTTIWDADGISSSYHNNVIGIGSDATKSGLIQKQSRQWDDSARIYVGALAANNAANLTSITNGQFVMMGNNAGRMYNNTGNTEFPAGFSLLSRFDREWKITNTGFTGTFSIDIRPEAGAYAAGSLRMLVDDNGDFSNATVINPTINYDAVTNTITLSGISNAMIPSNSTKFITLAVAAAPGGFTDNLYLWTKANEAVGTSGTNVSQWTNLAGTNMTNQAKKTATSNVTLNQSVFNYNPSVVFDGASNQRLSGQYAAASTNPAIFFAVVKKNGASSTSCINPVSLSPAGAMGIAYNTLSAEAYGVDGSGFSCSHSISAVDIPAIVRVDYNSASSATGAITAFNGLASSACGSGGLSTPDGIFEIGGRTYNGAGSLPGRIFKGSIAEVIHYNSNTITATEIKKVESYLAIKYGLTLSNSGGGTNGDYLSSAGITIWNANIASAYHNRVIGIGRDEASALLQKQSQQMDDSTRIYLDALQTTNAANSGVISDGQFVMMGSDAGKLRNNTANTEYPSGLGFNSRFDREWKITNTGFTGTFSIDIKPETGVYDASRIRVLVDDDGNFSNATVISPAISYSGGIITISGINHTMIGPGLTKFITLASMIPAPGGVLNNLSLWNDANADVSISTGTNINGWIDQTCNNTFTITGTPQKVDADLNYNPVVTFNGSSRFTGTKTINNITHAFAVGKIQNSSGVTTSGALIGTTTNAAGPYFFHTEGTSTPRLLCGESGKYAGANIPSATIPYSLLSEDVGQSASSEFIRSGGKYLTNDAGGNPIPFNAIPTLGSRKAENLLTGSALAEAILYNTSLSTADLNKVESYLAIKYGFTLSNSGGGANGNYTSSGGSLVWNASDNSSYHNQVIGIGKDFYSALLQKQSRQSDDSTRIYIGSLASSNAANTGTFTSADRQFVLIGHNGQKLRQTYGASIEYPAGLGIYSRLDREWKITNSNFTGTFLLDIKPNTSPITAADLRVLIDDDGNFTNATLYNPSISYAGGVITVSINNTLIPTGETKYFTIASINSTTPLPVQLKEFTARAIDNKYVQLDWQTASELNSESFIIERSVDGKQWQQVTIVNAAGNSSALLSYTYTDNDPLKGISYYRIKQKDADGKFVISPVRNVTIDNGIAHNLRIYPNPADNEVTIEGDDLLKQELKLYDALGKNLNHYIKIRPVNNRKLSVDLTNLPVGIYFVKTAKSVVKLYKQ